MISFESWDEDIAGANEESRIGRAFPLDSRASLWHKPDVDLAERNRLIALTKGFQQLRGLIYAPVALANAAFCIWAHMDPQHPQSQEAPLGALFALFSCALAASFAAWLYYRRRFGVVRPRRPGGVYAPLMTLVGLVAILALFGAMWVDVAAYEHPVNRYPLSFTCLAWALVYLAFYLYPFRLRSHSLWFAALFLGLAFLTLIGVVPKSQFFEGSGLAGVMLIWLAFSLHGLLDHLLLLRLLPKASVEQATAESGERHD